MAALASPRHPRLTTREEGAALGAAALVDVHPRATKLALDYGGSIVLSDGRREPAAASPASARPAAALTRRDPPPPMPRRKNESTLRLDHDDGTGGLTARAVAAARRATTAAAPPPVRTAADIARDQRATHFDVRGPDAPATVAALAYTRSSDAHTGAAPASAALPPGGLARGAPAHATSSFTLTHDTGALPRRASAVRGTIFDPVSGTGGSCDTVHTVLARSDVAPARKRHLLASHFTLGGPELS